MLRNRIRSNSGATILLALLFFLMCAMAGSVVLSAGSAAAGRIAGLEENQQAFYSVTSAAQLLRDEIEGQEFQAYREDGGNPQYTTEPDSRIQALLQDAIRSVYENKKPFTDALTISPVDNTTGGQFYEKYLGKVTAVFVMNTDYSIVITLQQEDADKYSCTLTAEALAREFTSTRDVTDEKTGEVTSMERVDTQVLWHECEINKD